MKRPHPEMTLRELVKYHVRTKQCAEGHLRKAVASLVAFVGHEATCGDLSARLVDEWASKVLPVYAPSTAKLYLVGIRSLWRRLLRAAELPANRRNGLQKLRRTSATALERVSPGSAAWHLGHKTPGMAAAHYLDPAQCSTPMLPPAIPTALQDAKKRKDDAAAAKKVWPMGHTLLQDAKKRKDDAA